MEKVFENVFILTTREDYDRVLSRAKELIKEATNNGALDDPEADNEYIREIGRLSRLGAEYENKYIYSTYFKKRAKSPSIKSVV